jgi:hypothetical protein
MRCFLVVCLAIQFSLAAAIAAERPPNIVVILADDK